MASSDFQSRIQASQLDTEDAETHNLTSIEGRRAPAPDTQLSGRMLDLLSQHSNAFAEGQDDSKPPTFKSIAQRVRAARRLSHVLEKPRLGHRKTSSSAHELLEAIKKDEYTDSQRGSERDIHKEADQVFRHNLHGPTQEESDEDEESISSTDDEKADNKELLPLIDASPDYGAVPNKTQSGGGGGSPVVILKRKTLSKWRRFQRRVCAISHPIELLRSLVCNILSSLVVLAAIPCFIVAWILYYLLGNPELEFLPGTATVSWWFNFTGRQILMLELARLTQWIVIEQIMLSRFSVKLFGPILTYVFLNSKGWPFIVATWASWDLLLLHGDNKFQSHWLYWTEIRIYSLANSGTYILASELYLRLLLSMIIAGFAGAVKRTFVATHFGRRQYCEFKPKLEKILQDVVLVSDVALIAHEAENLEQSEQIEIDVKATKSRQGLGRWHSVKFENKDEEGSEASAEEDEDVRPNTPVIGEQTGRFSRTSSGGLSKTPSGSLRIKDLLDRWEEPVNKSDKSNETSIQEVLKFNRLLQFIDNQHPFGEAFGSCANRDECISASHNVFRQLLRITPGRLVLPFSTLALAAYNDSDDEDLSKQKALRRVFRPDRRDDLTLLAFVQSVDAVYKRLRYFRASVGNASVINNVMESIINGIFYFVLGLLLLSFMQINPWTLLVSMTSLLVSVSFALGPSVSKYVEGVLLIVVRQ